MTFLAMIVALILLQVLGGNNALQQDDWFRSLQSTCRGLGFSPTVGFACYIAIPLIVVALLLGSLEEFLFGIVWIGGAAVVLLYSFGRIPFDVLVDRYRSYCHSGDFQAAYLFAQSELGLESGDDEIVNARDAHETMLGALLYAGYQRWASVLFYFVVLGPLGALAYRLLQLSRKTPEHEQAQSLLYYADWIPARLLAAGFSLTGDFLRSRDQLFASLSGPDQGAGNILLAVGRAAIGPPEVDVAVDDSVFSGIAAKEVTDLRALMSRSAGAWLIAISLLELFL